MVQERPYSVVRRHGDTFYVSGQLPLDEAGAIPDGIAKQTTCALSNIESAAHALGLTKGDVVKTTVYMTDFSQFGEMNKAYADFFNEPYPARSAVEVGALAAGASIEIEAVLAKRDKRVDYERMERKHE